MREEARAATGGRHLSGGRVGGDGDDSSAGSNKKAGGEETRRLKRNDVEAGDAAEASRNTPRRGE